MRYIFFFLMALKLFALNDFFNNSRDGFFYYKDDEKKKVKDKKEDKKKESIKDLPIKERATKDLMNIPFENDEEREERLEEEKRYIQNIPWQDLDKLSTDEYKILLETTRRIAVGTPKKEYVKAYMLLQKFWVDKSERFAKVWQVALKEDPARLFHDSFVLNNYAIKERRKKQQQKYKKFFNDKKDRLGFIVIVENKDDKDLMFKIKQGYKGAKKRYNINYKIVEFWEVPFLTNRLKIKLSELPANVLLYKGYKNRPIYKRLDNGILTSSQIVENGIFMFENGIEEEKKVKKDRK